MLLGNKWQELSGDKIKYFKVFDQNPIEDAYSLEQAKALIAGL
jgi:hypothetical protein